MPQDAFTLKMLCEELNSIFACGKINKIVQPDNDQVIFTVYAGGSTKKLLLNVNPSMPRIGITDEEKNVPLTAPNFCMLLRKHLLNATIDGISLVGFDRIVKIDLTASQEFCLDIKKTLYIELMGRYSNIILTENGKVLGGNRGINMFDDGIRPLFVGKPYVFPPVGDKKSPFDCLLKDIINNSNENNLIENVVKNTQGLALCTVKEMFFGKSSQKNAYETMLDFINGAKKNPCVLYNDGEIKDVFAFPYKTVSGEYKYFDYLWQAEEYYFKVKENDKIYKSRKDRLLSVVNTAIKKHKKKLSAISSKEKDALSCEDNRIKGELILANIYQIKQGQTFCELLNYYDNSVVKIELDDKLSPSKNAENYYKKYNKQKRTLEMLAPQKQTVENELDYLSSLLCEIENSDNIADLSFVQEELVSNGLIIDNNKTAKKKVKETFCREYRVNGFRVLVGRNNIENDKLTFTASPDDTWIHSKNYHSSHAIIYNDNKDVDQETIRTACEICAYYSKGRDGGKTEIVYTLKKNVKKPPKSKPGFCIYEKFRSMQVVPQKHEELLKND